MTELPFIGQNLEEFDIFLREFGRLNCDSFLEIGILRGGVLARIGSTYAGVNIVGIDPFPQVTIPSELHAGVNIPGDGELHNLERSRQAWGIFDPQIWNYDWGYLKIVHGPSQFESVRSEAMLLNGGRNFDAIFIDGDHEYEMVKKDWQWARQIANKIIGFHDVCHCEDERITVWKLWDEIKVDPNYRTLQLVGHGPDPQGIGIVYL